MIKEYQLTTQNGTILIENKAEILNDSPTQTVKGLFGIQIAKDGRVWICLDGVSFLRFKPDPPIEARWAIALRKTWDYIGGDILAANNNKDMPRSHVFECCVDYIYLHGGLSKEDLEAFHKRDFKKDRTLIKEAFPYARYGL